MGEAYHKIKASMEDARWAHSSSPGACACRHKQTQQTYSTCWSIMCPTTCTQTTLPTPMTVLITQHLMTYKITSVRPKAQCYSLWLFALIRKENQTYRTIVNLTPMQSHRSGWLWRKESLFWVHQKSWQQQIMLEYGNMLLTKQHTMICHFS